MPESPDSDLVFKIYDDDGQPIESGVFSGLAACVQALILLQGRARAADLLAGFSEKVRNPTWDPRVIAGGKTDEAE